MQPSTRGISPARSAPQSAFARSPAGLKAAARGKTDTTVYSVRPYLDPITPREHPGSCQLRKTPRGLRASSPLNGPNMHPMLRSPQALNRTQRQRKSPWQAPPGRHSGQRREGALSRGIGDACGRGARDKPVSDEFIGNGGGMRMLASEPRNRCPAADPSKVPGRFTGKLVRHHNGWPSWKPSLRTLSFRVPQRRAGLNSRYRLASWASVTEGPIGTRNEVTVAIIVTTFINHCAHCM